MSYETSYKVLERKHEVFEMKNKIYIDNEIKKLRKIVNSNSFTETQRHSAWCVMLSLQWVCTDKKYPGISPLSLVVPRLQKWELK